CHCRTRPGNPGFAEDCVSAEGPGVGWEETGAPTIMVGLGPRVSGCRMRMPRERSAAAILAPSLALSTRQRVGETPAARPAAGGGGRYACGNRGSPASTDLRRWGEG